MSPLTTGARLGPYEIIAALGSGGMGEVYRARDTKLGREVAIKILPPEFASDPDRLARFEREARLLASLNHPNIATIHGVEGNAIVMELVDGPTLQQRLEARDLKPQRALPIDEALAIARQIADALDAAHEKGIVHRDLKPANIKLTADGVVKVLDFGLATAVARPDVDLSTTPTMNPTHVGTIVGTAAYMSPEQARGLAVDKRTDIWAFGCVLYEMLTGRQAFTGHTLSDVMARVLEREPDWAALPPTLPPAIRRLLRRCLQKDQKRRLRDIADAAIDLDEPEPAASAASAPATPRSGRRALVWLAAGVLLASAAFGVWWRVGAARALAPRDVRFQRLTDFVGIEDSPAMSPDGKTVAFVAHENGRRHVWIRLLAGGAPLKLTPDDVDANWPRWAPDSGALVYHVPASTPGEEGTLWEISALGGSARRITSALGGGDISHDGTRVAAFQVHGGKAELTIVSRDGSVATRVAPLTAGSVNMSPRWSPDDRWIAFQTIESGSFDNRIEVVPAAGGAPRIVARGMDFRGLSWLPDGSGMVFSSSKGSTLPYPPTFSLRMVALDGTAERQLTFGDFSYVDPDVHTSGALVATQMRNQSDVWRFPVDGSPAENVRRAVRITRQTGAAQTPSLSPDGSEIVYLSDSGGHGNLWVAKTDGSGVRQITFERDAERTVGVPVWSPTSGTIAFIFTRGGTTEQWLVNRDGSGLRRLTPGVWAYWSPDGRWLYVTVQRAGRFCIDKMPVEGGPAVAVRCDALGAALAPDGATLYFVTPLLGGSGGWDMEVSKARPENGPATLLTRLSGSRIPYDPFNIHTIVSPDGRWLALPLTDGTTSNLWALPADGGALRPLTDFGDRAVTIVRRIAWTHDSRSIYAAVADIDADVVLLDGLLR